MCIETYGFHPHQLPKGATGIPGRITSVCHGYYEFVSDAGTGLARLKSSAYHPHKNHPHPTTGDFVLIDWQEQGESRILATLPRRTSFLRADPSASGHREQAIAANFDTVFILQSLDRDFNLKRLERYLTLAWQSGAVPVVVLTKADCVDDPLSHIHAAQCLAIGVDVFAVSAQTGSGLHQLDTYLKPGKTIVFLGSSGVGKSSLINTLAGETLMCTQAIREKDSRGRHTTTRRQLFLLKNGVMVIDTPGMRELGMWEVSCGITKSFADVEQYLGQCKFSDCRHESEPGCAIKSAILRGDLSQARWESYAHLEAEARFGEDKAGYLRKKEQFFKGIAKSMKQKPMPDYRHTPCNESFTCKVCGAPAAPEDAGSRHRNHCPQCLASMHVDNKPGDRASLCKGVMDPIGVWVRNDNEWAVIHRCRSCGTLSSNRIAADDNPLLLMSIATKPLASPPFPLWQLDGAKK